MLGGHAKLFAPPELELLSFETLQERRRAFSGKYEFWLEGTLRALMEILGCDADRAKEVMSDYETRDVSTREFYAQLQNWIGDRILVDKTPSYSLDLRNLECAERDFDGAFYIHLLRHPCAMIRSFEQARLDQVFFLLNHRYPRRLLAELIWVISQENILEFLRRVPAERKCVVQFERLVEDPQREMSRLCDLIGLPFDPATLDPYGDHQKRMSDGIHPESRMLGDVKFHDHRGVEAAAANAWKKDIDPASLGEATLRLATALGYEVPAGSLHGERPALSPEKVEVPPRVSSQGPTVAKLSQHSGTSWSQFGRPAMERRFCISRVALWSVSWRFCRPGIRYIGASWSTPREKEFAIPRLKLSPPTIAARYLPRA